MGQWVYFHFIVEGAGEVRPLSCTETVLVWQKGLLPFICASLTEATQCFLLLALSHAADVHIHSFAQSQQVVWSFTASSLVTSPCEWWDKKVVHLSVFSFFYINTSDILDNQYTVSFHHFVLTESLFNLKLCFMGEVLCLFFIPETSPETWHRRWLHRHCFNARALEVI